MLLATCGVLYAVPKLLNFNAPQQINVPKTFI
jgi:hypothetical protein